MKQLHWEGYRSNKLVINVRKMWARYWKKPHVLLLTTEAVSYINDNGHWGKVSYKSFISEVKFYQTWTNRLMTKLILWSCQIQMHLDISVLNSEQKGFFQMPSCITDSLHPKVPVSFLITLTLKLKTILEYYFNHHWAVLSRDLSAHFSRQIGKRQVGSLSKYRPQGVQHSDRAHGDLRFLLGP